MRILCYGDSNTWGYDPRDGSRLSAPWPTILKEKRPFDTILTDALCGRTIIGAMPGITGSDGGKTFFRKYVESDICLDWIILALGANDLSCHFPDRTPADLTNALRSWIHAIRQKKNGASTRFLVVAPVSLREPCLTHPVFGPHFDRTSLEKSRALPAALSTLTKEAGVVFLDANTVSLSSSLDGIHMETEEQAHLAEAIDACLTRQSPSH